MRVALLSGGTGGAKLARGLLDAVGGDTLTVVANTGDDVEALFLTELTARPDVSVDPTVTRLREVWRTGA